MEYKLYDRSRVDCITSTHVYEVDFGRKGYESIGQALYYSLVTNKKPGILLIREKKKDDSGIGKVKKLADKYNIQLYIVNIYLQYNLLRN